jgi:protein involved in polysaccharide export with SLBB domain
MFVGMLVPGAARAQVSDTALMASRRSMVTRAELQAALDEIDRGTSSGVYSAALRANKQAEAQVIRTRLTEGDLRPADEITIAVLNEPGLSGVYTVSPTRTLTLPGNNEISLKGVLRSEAQDYLTKEFKRFLNDPSLTVTTNVRISILGAVVHPGFFQVPASSLVSFEIMHSANGPSGNVLWKKSTIKRGDTVIVDGPAFEVAMREGMTFDQLNVQAGDEIEIAAKPSSARFWRILGGVSALATIFYLVHNVL